MTSLSVHEARVRSQSIAVTSYDVALDLTRGEETFRSRTVVEFRSRDRQATFVDLRPVEVHDIHLNRERLDPETLEDGRLHLDNLLDDNVLVIDATMAYSHDGEGLHRSVDPEDQRVYVYAMSFLDAAPRIFACFDQPDLKAPYTMHVTVPTDWRVIGNASATEEPPGQWTLATTPPLATYFVGLVAGPFHHLTREHDGITMGLHCRQTLAEHLDKDADELFTLTAQCFDEYHRLFGIRYPFGEYHQAFVPEFNAGAMENPGCVTFRDDLIFKAQATDSLRAERANVMAHEMAHQWFGDLVTMRWWDDLWLNESFAEYMGYRVCADVTAFDESWLEFAVSRKAWGLAADQRSSTHPVAGNGARDAHAALNDFDGISYAKGAATLRQLNAYLGDGAFIGGVVEHLRQHAFGNATFGDLVAAWEQASGKDVTGWADGWLRTAGVDTLACVIDPDGQPLIERRVGSTPRASRPHAITVAWYPDAGPVETTALVVTGHATPVRFSSYDGSGLVLLDAGDETWAKIQLDDASVGQAPARLRGIEDPLARAVVWGALREALMDARLDPGRYLAIAEEALPHEPCDLTLEAVLGRTGSSGLLPALGTFFAATSDPERVARLVRRLLDAATPGSNRQLIMSRAHISATDGVLPLQTWLDGGAPTGLKVDADIRWRVLKRLCAAGEAGRPEISAESARDPSSQGHLHALACRAVMPDPAVKEEVWTAIRSDERLSNHDLYALAADFFRADQTELTGPYVGRYFSDLPATSAFRSGWIVERSADLAFPRYAVDAETLSAAVRTLERDDLDAGVRRAISDRSDDLRRVVASRERFSR